VRAEISYVMIKPDGVQRGLVGEVISRFERKGFRLAGLKLMVPDRALAEEHYGELSSKPFFPDLIDYIISGPVVAMVWEGNGVVASFRKLVGATDPLKAEPGTVRGDFGRVTGRNIVHASDSPENGERETALWFKEGLSSSWEPTMTPWLVE
jgi:nucleoside-diphosphate kinase